MQRFETAQDAALALRPDQPVYAFRPSVLATDAKSFLSAFRGQTAYAVKTNGEPFVLDELVKAGVTAFDVASPAEFAAARAASADAGMFYMHPVKAQSDIRLALETYGIRHVALDHEDEIAKILRIVRAQDIAPSDITLFVRLATKGHAAYELSKKFGATAAHAVELLQRLDRVGFRAGLTFHVGSQVEDLDTYERAIGTAAWVKGRAGVDITALDIGGGFPAPYGRDLKKDARPTPEIGSLVAKIEQEIDAWGLGDLPLIAEPGRVVVARSLSVVVRVLLKKGQRLYINDGVWSSLSDSWTGKITLPARLIPDPARRRAPRSSAPKLAPYRVMGATCDSVDILSRPFWLPDTVDTGDWIEIGHIGAYSLALRTRFNGFYPDTFVEVATPYEDEEGLEGVATVESRGAVR
ncbi:ornithine decarboxylase [Methylopila capsulata]|uniref:Ornithine decarboxylase n=1 Tax=Methylopila capsulata TaxID=61654 RepID=A0A9W6ITQ4_9HYPH|nr:ornithine decarboxylase [Methylopila capsulata]MBM7852137.1 ornithine decarboxylase [Methylopila capsulata]GLK56343.1 ornithine decarboxylase [Methylopila capsulata]